jgi:hypothetical protein
MHLFVLLITYNLNGVVFSLYIIFTIHPLTFYRGWIVQNFVFFQFGPQTLFGRFSPN